MKKMLLAALVLWTGAAFSQLANQSIVAVTSLPASCSSPLPMWIVISTGTVYSCQSGVPTAIGGSGSFNALTGDATSTATGGATTVQGLEGVPFCTGYTPTNGQAVTLTTASSPNPCYTATTAGGGTTTNALTLNNSGSGAASGSTFNGSAPITLSYNTLGASPLAGSSSLTTTGTLTSGATGAGFTLALGTSTLTGILPGASGGTGNGFFAVSGPATSLKTFTFPNASATILSTNAVVTAGQGGTGVANTATLTLGSSNQNWATLGTGIVKNTTTTGAISDAAAADVYALWSGSCSASTFLRGDGACASASGSTGISGLTANYIPLAGSATTITANSHMDDGVTTASTITSSEPFVATTLTSSAPGGGVGSSVFLTQEGTVPSGLSAAGQDDCYADSTQHGLLCNFNAGTTLPLVQGPASNTTGHLATWSGTNGGKLVDGGAVPTGTVTSIATTSPIGGGTITGTGTITCATCVTSAASLTSNAVVIGGGSQASSTISADTTTTHALFATGTAPAFRAIASGDIPAAAVPAVNTVVDTSSPVTVSTTQNAEYHFNENATAATAMTYNLPTAAAGKQFCISNAYNGSAANTGVITIATSASGQFIIFTDGTLSATGGNVTSGGAARDSACVVGVDSTHWALYVQSGTFTKH